MAVYTESYWPGWVLVNNSLHQTVSTWPINTSDCPFKEMLPWEAPLTMTLIICCHNPDLVTVNLSHLREKFVFQLGGLISIIYRWFHK